MFGVVRIKRPRFPKRASATASWVVSELINAAEVAAILFAAFSRSFTLGSVGRLVQTLKDPDWASQGSHFRSLHSPLHAWDSCSTCDITLSRFVNAFTVVLSDMSAGFGNEVQFRV